MIPKRRLGMPIGLKDVGVALALLAIYILVLLSPLHQAAGLQRELAALGFTSLDTWSICGQLAKADDEDSVPVAKCAASGLGKNEVAVLANTPISLQPLRAAAAAQHWSLAALAPAKPPGFAGQPRAPPMSV